MYYEFIVFLYSINFFFSLYYFFCNCILLFLVSFSVLCIFLLLLLTFLLLLLSFLFSSHHSYSPFTPIFFPTPLFFLSLNHSIAFSSFYSPFPSILFHSLSSATTSPLHFLPPLPSPSLSISHQGREMGRCLYRLFHYRQRYRKNEALYWFMFY